MADNKTINGLLPVKIKSIKKENGDLTFSDFDKIIKKIKEPGFALFYFDFGIHFGYYDRKKLHFKDLSPITKFIFERIQLARIFNLSQELKIWRIGQNYKWRIISDSVELSDRESYFDGVDAKQLLWGTSYNDIPLGKKGLFQKNTAINGHEIDRWIEATEKRGVKITFPFGQHNNEIEANKNNRFAIHTRNYVSEVGAGLASYNDSRFVNIEIV